MPRARRVAGLALFLALLLLLPLPTEGAKRKSKAKGSDEPRLKDWITGPVRYIARAEEARQFKSLANDDDRALFIERFWSRRDPTPGTLNNEYRQMFWERVREANATFHRSTRPGWMTDRGKIFILYGPPTDKQTAEDLYTEGIPGGARGVIRWIYEGRPGNRLDLDAIVVVAFVRDYTGEYRLTSDPKLNSVFFDVTMRDHEFQEWYSTFLPRRSELSVMLDLGKLQEVPPQEQVLLERVETTETYRTRPLDAHLARYRHPDEPGHVAVVTIDLSDYPAGRQPALLARFTPRDATSAPRIIGEGRFRIEGEGAQRVAQGRLLLPPGTYDLLLLAADPFDATTGIYRGVMVIPQESERLEISDVTVARVLEPLPYRALVSYDEPFLLGPYRVVPRFHAVLRPGEPLELLAEVYGGQPPYRLAYRLEGLEADGRWVALARPQEIEHSQTTQAWGLPTGPSWPAGSYRVRIEVTDAEGGTTGVTVPFTLAEEEPAG